MMYSVIVDVIQPRIVAPLVRKAGVPKLKPHLASKHAVHAVNRPCCSRMETLEHQF